MRTGIEALGADLARQQRAIGERVPAYGRLLAALHVMLDGSTPFEAALARTWHGRRFGEFYERPLLILAAVRHDALLEGPSHPLFDAIAAARPDPSAVTSERLMGALSTRRDRVWETLARRHVQTNETTRAVAWLRVAHVAGADEGARPLHLVDLGASAGLNLVADALPAPWTVPGGAPLGVVRRPDVRLRLGLDAQPLDAGDPEAVDWMRACVWPGETDRLTRFEASVAAIRVARGRPDAPRIEALDLSDAAERLEGIDPGPNGLVLAYQTLVVDYLSPATRQAYVAGMTRWLAGRAPGQAAWVALELAHGGPASAHSAAITVTLRTPSGVESLEIARCGYHPAEVILDTAAEARVAAALGG